jgi:phosphatidylglycerol lysyltransferase
MIKSSRVLAHNPTGTIISVSWASLSAILNMLCLVAIGFAFGYTEVPVLVAAFALAAVSVIVSPTPQGVGVVEAAIAAIITGAGGELTTATTIALVYRGIMFWLPFCIGALLLGQTDFFSSKDKKADPEQQKKDVAWVSGTFVGITGLVNIGLNFVPQLFEPYAAAIQFINFGDIFFGPTLGIMGVLLLVLAIGLVMRFHTAWGLTVVLLVLVASVEFLFYATITVAAVMIALIVWLVWHRYAFDKPITQEAFRITPRKREGKAA